MPEHACTAALVLRLVAVILTVIGLTVSIAWLAYAVYLAPSTSLMAPRAALMSLVLPASTSLLLALSRPLARVITADLNPPMAVGQ